jgi:hypothetical protein
MRVEALHLIGEVLKCTGSEDDAGCRLIEREAAHACQLFQTPL